MNQSLRNKLSTASTTQPPLAVLTRSGTAGRCLLPITELRRLSLRVGDPVRLVIDLSTAPPPAPHHAEEGVPLTPSSSPCAPSAYPSPSSPSSSSARRIAIFASAHPLLDGLGRAPYAVVERPMVCLPVDQHSGVVEGGQEDRAGTLGEQVAQWERRVVLVERVSHVRNAVKVTLRVAADVEVKGVAGRLVQAAFLHRTMEVGAWVELPRVALEGEAPGAVAALVVDSIPAGWPVSVGHMTRVEFIRADEHKAVSLPEPDFDDVAQPQVLSSLNPSVRSIERMLLAVGRFHAALQEARIEAPRGVLLHGPPGVGKTFSVRQIARHCGTEVITVHGPSVVSESVFVGQAEERLRLAFAQACEREEPCILLLDQLDVMCPKRSASSSDDNARLVGQLLTLLDGQKQQAGRRFLVIATTNRPNMIDPALRRPGRLDREVELCVPSATERSAMLAYHLADMEHEVSEADLEDVGQQCVGFVGADLASLVREAAMAARIALSNTVRKHDLVQARSVVVPSSRRSHEVPVERVSWDDIGGLEDVKRMLRRAVEWPLEHPDTMARLGLQPARGILLHGPPGCSKTTLVKALATSSRAAFLSLNGASVRSSYVGEAERLLRQLFTRARANAPCVVFFDEFDAIVSRRSLGDTPDALESRILATLLTEMDGVSEATGVLVVAATNRVDMLDDALLRPGRFDHIVEVPLPDVAARAEILRIKTKSMELADDVDLDALAAELDGYSGAELTGLVTEAALTALRADLFAARVQRCHFDAAVASARKAHAHQELHF